MNLKENTERVFQQIKDASQQSGREANSVSVVAVTKYVDVPTAEALLPLGVHHIGENRVDKFLEKYEALKDRNITLHLIEPCKDARSKMSFSMLIISMLWIH